MAGSASATGLKSRNMPHAKQTTKRLEEENTKMEERLRELRMAMDREKSNREKSQLGFWKSGQMGTLSTYGKEVMQSKLEKKLQKKSGKKIVILQEEKIEPVNRPKGPGTLAYIASKGKGSVSDRISKGQRCGQCEEKLANRKCLECGENFCASCFAVFHLKGALKKHRAVPVDATTGRQPGTPKQTSRVSSARREKSSPVGERQSHREKPSREETPRFEDKPAVVQKQSLLYGTYDEAENAAAFQEALGAWRKDEKPTAPVPSKIRAGPKSSASGTDCGTSTADNDTKHPVEIKFTNSLSYAEKLLLKTSRRAQSQPLQVGDNGSMMINMSPEVEKTWNSPVSRIGLGFSEANNGESDSHWQSAPGLVMEDRPESSISIIEINEDQFLSRQSSVFDEPPSYLVQEIPDKERKGGGRRKEAFAVDDNDSRKPPKSYAHGHKSENESQRSNREKYSTNYEQQGRSSLGQPMNREHSKLDSFREPDMKSKAQTQSDSKKRPSSRVQNTPSEKRPNSQMQNENNKRPSSQMRNDKRPTSRLASARKRPTSRYEMRKEGVITRAPSSSLQDIASRGRTEAFDQISYQAVDLANFFAPGIQNRNETTGESSSESSEKVKSRPNTAMNQQWKISNRLYQMTPRSWRPDNSLIDAGDRSASTCSNIDGTYSVNNKTTSEHLIDDHPTAINQGRLTPNLMFNAEKMYSPRGRASPASQSFLKTKSRSEVATPTAKKRSVDQFEDDMSTTFEEINQEDMLTLKLLQDELADEGRKQSFTVTSHPGGVGSEKNLDGTKEWQGQPTSQEKQNAYLRASVLMDDYEIMEELMMKEESDVKALQ